MPSPPSRPRGRGMNGAVRRVGLTVFAMVVILLCNQTYVQVVEAPRLVSDPRDDRGLLAELARPRGAILAGGVTVASSARTPGADPCLRTYPQGPAFAPVTGYLSAQYGATGLEQSAGPFLDGSDQALLWTRIGNMVTGGRTGPPSVVTTIDPRMQQVAYQDMSSRGYTGAVVAIQPSTGAILTMVSTPSADPDPLSAPDPATQQRAWSADAAAAPSPLEDRATDQVYPPGSTFKLVDLSAALQDGYSPDTPVTADPRITLPDGVTTLENYDGEHCGPGSGDTVPLSEALARSCNTAFATVADRVGADRLRSQAAAYGIGQSGQRIPTPVTPSALGALADSSALAQSGIGQRDVRLTPLQNAEIVATIANGGVRMAPHLVREVDAADGSVITRTEPEELDRAIPADVAGTIRDMMIGSEQLTTGNGSIPGVTIASKTGTAEHGVDSKITPPHTWYVAFAPAQTPQVAIAVIVENGGNDGDAATGASVASPVARDVMAAALADGVGG